MVALIRSPGSPRFQFFGISFGRGWGRKKPKEWRYCFITDGGHNDNLGIAPLVFRNCRLVIISDATMDPQHDFADFMKAFRRYRIRGGISFCRLEDWPDLADQGDQGHFSGTGPASLQVGRSDGKQRETPRPTELDRGAGSSS